MARKVMTAFRLYEQTLERIDALVANPPAWLNTTGVHPIQDRTDLIERLVYAVAQQSPLQSLPDDQPHTKAPIRSATGRGQKAKKQRKS